MKKIIHILLVTLLGGAFSCTEMLEDKNYSQIDSENFYRNAKEAEVVLLGVYRPQMTDLLYGWNLTQMFAVSDDILQVGIAMNVSTYRELTTLAHTPTTSYILETWEALYSAVYNANHFIETMQKKIGDFPESDKPLGEIYIAEAKALRALYYYELVRNFGNIALLKSTDDSRKKFSEYEQFGPEEVYAFIEQDLLDAQILPWSTADDVRPNSAFRMSKGAALGLLARVYATWAGFPVWDESKWQKAAETAEIVIESGRHTLLPNYEDLWKNVCSGVWDPRESLIEFSAYVDTYIGADPPVGRIGKFNGVVAAAITGVRGTNQGNAKVMLPFNQEFKASGDPRYALSIATFQYTASGTSNWSSTPVANAYTTAAIAKQWGNCTPAKWDIIKYMPQEQWIQNTHQSCVNWYFQRYPDVLLLYAEAVNEWKNGPTEEAREAINKIRRRGYGKPVDTPDSDVDIPAGLSYQEFKNVMRWERKVELCFEGSRKYDLIRWGEFYESVMETNQKMINGFNAAGVALPTEVSWHYQLSRYITKNKHELMPIPQTEMDLLSQFKPNPGWGG